MVGFRTATHAFRYGTGPHAAAMDEAWPIKVFGQKWITHHGHFGDGHELLTEVTINPDFKHHPICAVSSRFRRIPGCITSRGEATASVATASGCSSGRRRRAITRKS